VRKSAKLIDLPLEPDGNGVIEALDKARALADTGTISMVAITIIDREGCTQFIRSEVRNRSSLIGALARQQYRLMQQADEDKW
jgi:hypothetical protein